MEESERALAYDRELNTSGRSLGKSVLFIVNYNCTWATYTVR
jgi:hypothetical protein